ncbi:MAG: DUF106 domain-containing protein [Candidatus Nealsonbacteria bacterium]|nr:DUF106 domain-containing protein [Candidatus Nealsonbacteria bacterium]
MTDMLLRATLAVGDLLFGWALFIPPVLTVAVLGILTSGLMLAVRRWTTDQDLLGRADADKRRLKVLMREAKAVKDKAAVKRLRTTNGEIALKLMGAEVKPSLLAILPLVLIGTWGWYRLGYVPPQEDEPVLVELSLPASAAGSVAFLVPQEGIRVKNGYVTHVEEVEGRIPAAVAKWTVCGKAAAEPFTLVLNHGKSRFEHDLLIGQRTYATDIVLHEPGRLLPQSYVRMRVPKIAGLVEGPQLDDWGGYGALLPSWVVTYLLVVIPFYFGTKRLFRLH